MPEDQKAKSTIRIKCRKCFLPVSQRKGSLTSWIFGVCKCDSNTVQLKLKPGNSSNRIPLGLDLGLDDCEGLSVIGEGGMGTVYKVRYKPLDKILAVKVLKSEFALDKGAIKRFEQEGKAASQLTHPNMVGIYKYGLNKGGCPYLLMDYLAGPSLDSVISNEAYLDVPRALHIFKQIAESLGHAHEKGIIHRDVKPSNIILLNKQGSGDFVKIVDFGIAKILPVGDKRTLLKTQTGDIFGSPQYMSPEQCRGDKLDIRSDIYSMGCLMYEALSGNPPFVGDNPIRIILQHLNDRPVHLTERFPGLEIPSDLDSVVMTCLEKQPDNRYQSMKALLADLVRIEEGRPITFRSKISAKNVKDLRSDLNVMPDSASGNKKPQIYSAVGASLVLIILVAAFMFFGNTNQTGGTGATWKQLYAKGQQAFDQGDYGLAKSLLERSLKAAEAEDNRQKKSLMQLATYGELEDLATVQKNAEDLRSLRTQIIPLQSESAAQDSDQIRRVMTTRDALKAELANGDLTRASSREGKERVDDHILGLCHEANDELAWCVEQHKIDEAIDLAAPLSKLLKSFPTREPELDQRCALNFGSALLEKERFSEAASQLNAAVHLALNGQSQRNLGLCHLQLGRAWIGLRSFDKAKIELNQASQFFEGESEKKALLAACNFEQGVIFAHKGESDLAEREFLLALSIFQKLEPPDQGAISDTNFQLAMLNKGLDRNELAQRYLSSGIDAAESLVERAKHENAVLAFALFSQGDIQAKQEQFDKAKPYFARAALIADRSGNEKKPMIEIGKLYLVILDPTKQHDSAEIQALCDDICKSYSHQPLFLSADEVVSNLVIMGRFCAQAKQYQTADHLLSVACALATAPDNRVLPMQMSDAMVQSDFVLRALGRRADAIGLQRSHMSLLKVKFSYTGDKPPPLHWLKPSLDQIASGDYNSATWSQNGEINSGGATSSVFTEADFYSIK